MLCIVTASLIFYLLKLNYVNIKGVCGVNLNE